MNFNSFTFESKRDINNMNIKRAAGVAITWNNQILLVHPTGASWKKSALGIPKGKIEEGEEPIDAAVRELREETGILIDKANLSPSPDVINAYDKNGNVNWQLIYYNFKIDSPLDIGMNNTRVQQDNLQLEEIDWAGFVPFIEAYPIIHRNQLIILDRVV